MKFTDFSKRVFTTDVPNVPVC